MIQSFQHIYFILWDFISCLFLFTMKIYLLHFGIYKYYMIIIRLEINEMDSKSETRKLWRRQHVS